MTTPEFTKWLRDNSSGEHSPAAAAADLIDDLLQRFTKLDKPKYSGEPMLDSVLGTTNADFRAWVESLPPLYWSRYDLSAARIGWEAACENQETKSKPSPAEKVSGKRVAAHRLVRFVAYVVKSHRFFIRESYSYSGTAFIRHPFQWLRAYYRFMWSSAKDGFLQANAEVWDGDP